MTTTHALTSLVAEREATAAGDAILTVGMDEHALLTPLVSALESQGLQLISVRAPGELPRVLGQHARAAVLVYCGQAGEIGNQVLNQVSRAHRNAPVIVIVDRADFGHYYELMCEGAYDYYELSEGAEVIARAVRWAARTRGA